MHTSRYAAEHGQLELLKEARAAGCPWESYTCEYHDDDDLSKEGRRLSTVEQAAKNGHVGVLAWAVREGAPWGEGSCRAAAAEGQLEALRWLE